MGKKRNTFYKKIIICLIFIYICFNNLFKNKLKKKCIIAHRGYWKKYEEQNSIKSVEEAIKKKFKGVELDIFYDKKINDFVLSHDIYDNADNLLKLKDILKVDIPRDFLFWLDLKNLCILNAFNCRKKILEYKKEFNIDIIIESFSFIGLIIISYNSNIDTSFNIINFIQLLLPQILFKYISIDYRLYDLNSSLYNIFSKNPINIFTVNNKNKLKYYYSNKRISIILTDNYINENKL